jgi:hypothetical protein
MAEDKGKETPKAPKRDPQHPMVYVIFGICVVGVLTWPAGVVGWLGHKYGPALGRVERIAVALGAIVGMILIPHQGIVEPVAWSLHVLRIGHGPLWPLPWLGFLLEVMLYAAVLDTLFSTRVGGHVRLRIKDHLGKPKNPFAKESLLPTDERRQALNIVPIPGAGVGQHHLQHSSYDTAPEAGARSIAFAIDHQGRPVSLSEGELGMHGAILGSTGSGKSKLIESLSSSLMDIGWAGVLIDLKEDSGPGGLRDFCRSYTSHHGIPFQDMALSDASSSSWLNPLAGMNADEARDTILSLTDFDDAYWQNINKKMLGQLVNLCFDAHTIDPSQAPYPTISGIGRIMEEGDLKRATQTLRGIVEMGGSIDKERYSALSNPDVDGQKSAAGFGAKLTQMYDTIAGRTVLAAGPGKTEIDVTQRGLTYIGLDSTGKPDLAKLVSSAALQRMSVFASQRTTGFLKKDGPRFLIIDEASVVDRSLLQALLSKARGAGVCVVVCTQGPDDWIDKKGDDWSMLIQNINFGIIMSQGSPKAAELCADFIGSEQTHVLSQRVGENVGEVEGSVSQRVDYKIFPHEIRQLKVGEAILRVSKPDERVTWLAVQMRDPAQ